MISGLLLWLSNAIAQAPVADFSATPTTGCGPLTVQFKDQSSNSPLYWSWDFGNGQISSLKNPAVTYVNPGTYTVKLIARNTSGSNAIVKTDYITVNPYPTPRFSANLTLACAPTDIQLTDQSTPGQGSISSWAWDFGDGNTSSQQNPVHNYTQPGYYTISLKVTNSSGCSNTGTQTRYLRIVNGIQPNFTYNQSSTSCSAPFIGQLLNQSAGPGNLTYNWTIGNGASPASSADTSPIVTFPNSGQYNVTLQVASSLGCNATTKQTLNFSNSAAVLNGPTAACVNTPIAFSDGSSPIPPTIVWDFGDGTGSNTASVSKIYASTGTYTVKLVNKYTGCADSTTQTVNVQDPPVADFTTGDPTNTCKPPLTIHFTDRTAPAAASWHWDFGDGQTSTDEDPVHTYNSSGSFTVTLTATGAGNCPNSISKANLINILDPTVTIGGTLTACMAGTSNFNAIGPIANVNAVDGVKSYAWSAPGSNEVSSAAQNPTFTYASTGTYTLSVTITTNGGCTATANASINIGSPLAPDFTTSVDPTHVCTDQQITFTSTTPGPPQDWLWDFGDHTALVDGSATVNHHYTFYGNHNVTLSVFNGGCEQQITKPIQIFPPSLAGFSYALPTPIQCTNESLIQFTDTTTTSNNTAL
ncbi:MAG TPA: PKD domain-containing protein, partial [Puia sp.]|nr:PKD domain-containing protein [Puia sp.]